MQPPENELQKARESNVALSEHQLRVQASLQKLNIPDWYKQYSGTHNTSANTSYYNKSDVTGLLRKRNSDIGRWQGLNSKTTSLSSLGSNRSDRSPVMLSPSAHSHTGGQSSGFSRFVPSSTFKVAPSLTLYLPDGPPHILTRVKHRRACQREVPLCATRTTTRAPCRDSQ